MKYKTCRKNGFSVVQDFCGHGIGVYKRTYVLHYGKKGQVKIKEGMIFTNND